MKYLIVTLVFLVSWSLVSAQTIVKGKVSDAVSGEELIGVSISTSDGVGTITEYGTGYEIGLGKGNYTLTFTYVGYADLKKEISTDGTGTMILDVRMEEASEIFDIVTVTGSRVEKNITKETSSIEVIRPEFIERSVNTDLAQVIERIPGVQVVDGQANIRSGSGFAYAAGSRVAVVVDEQPLLSAELSDVKWNFIPMENAAQIEIIKGASSVLYGSGGLNGVINVRTAYPTSEPYTKVSVYSGMYHISKNSPEGYNRRWYGRQNDSTYINAPFFSGMYFSHRQKIKENFDLVLGSNIHYDRSFLRSADEQRYRFNANMRYRLPKNDKITIGLSSNLMFHKRAEFFLWIDGYDDAYVPIDYPSTSFGYYTLTLDPYLTAFDKMNNKHTAKLRYFTINKLIGDGSPTAVTGGEYQFQREMDEIGLVVTAGASYQHFYAKSNLFEDELVETETDTFTQYSSQNIDISAAYFQMDKSFLDEKLNLTFGGRVENFRGTADNPITVPVFRGGVNYAVSKTDFLRASFGQGYRVPSLAEKFTSANITDEIGVFSNPDLKPESGSSTEVGYKKAFKSKKGDWKGFFDAAIFMMDYNDMTEFQFGLHGPNDLGDSVDIVEFITNLEYLGFKANNVSRARIAGWEVSSFAEGKIGMFPVRFWTGYTYSYPGDLSDDPSQRKAGQYIKNMFRAFALKADDPLVNSILNFRALHVARLDLEMDYKSLTLGTSLNYNGYMYNVDDFFKGEGDVAEWGILLSPELAGIVESLTEFRSNRAKGDLVWDIRASYRFKKKHQLDLGINNVLNRQYAVRPLKMNAPMTFNMRYSKEF